MDGCGTSVFAEIRIWRTERDGETQEPFSFGPRNDLELSPGDLGLSEIEDPGDPSIAERADLNPKYIGEVERGGLNISMDALVRIAKALRIRVHDLTKEF